MPRKIRFRILFRMLTYHLFRTLGDRKRRLAALLPFLVVAACLFGKKIFASGKGAKWEITSAEKTSTGIIAKMGAGDLEFSFVSDNCLRVNFRPEGKSSEDTAVVQSISSLKENFSTEISSSSLVISSSKLRAEVSRADCVVSIFNMKGELLLSQAFGDSKAGTFRFAVRKDINFYGVGGFNAWEKSSRGLLRGGLSEIRAGSQGGCGAPLIWTSAGFGLLADTDGGAFNVSGSSLSLRGVSKTDLEYFVIAGSAFDIMKSVHSVSGRPPLFPKWSSGFINTEWGIDQKELVSLVDEYRRRQIPLDAFILDFDWKAWGADDYGEWRWSDMSFPDGKSGRLAEILAGKGVKLGGILKPRIHMNTKQGDYALSHSFFWPGKKPYLDYFSQEKVNDLNFANAECRKWFWENLIGSYDAGIKAFWNDEADEGFDNMQHMNMQKALYDGQRSHDNLRVWSLNRNFYLGAQRYAYAMWSGDIRTGFDSMKIQRERMLSAVNIGAMRWGMDTGGFNGMPSDENYARWMQFSAFCPVFRVHGTLDMQRQPWVHDELAQKASVDAIKLRYSLLPYIYSYERSYNEDGVYLVRPLFWENPKDEKLRNYVDGWYFGEYLVVYPVVDENQKSKEIYLPDGKWIGFFDGKIYGGGRHVLSVDRLSWTDIPLFIKSGAIIPSSDVLNYVGEKKLSYIYINVFPDDAESSFVFYDDDGETYDYEKGKSFSQKISQKKEASFVRVSLSKPRTSFVPSYKSYVLKIYGEYSSADGFAPAGNYAKLLESDGGYVKSRDARGEFIAVKVKCSEKEIIVR